MVGPTTEESPCANYAKQQNSLGPIGSSTFDYSKQASQMVPSTPSTPTLHIAKDAIELSLYIMRVQKKMF